MKPELTTERMKIVRVDTHMAYSAYHNSLDEDNVRFAKDEVFGSVDDATKALSFLMGCYGLKNMPQVYAVCLNTGENIGNIYATPRQKGKYRVSCHIVKPYTKKGYATEAMKGFLPFILNSLGLDEIYAICNDENIAIIKVLEKCSFSFIGSEPCLLHGKPSESLTYIFQKQ